MLFNRGQLSEQLFAAASVLVVFEAIEVAVGGEAGVWTVLRAVLVEAEVQLRVLVVIVEIKLVGGLVDFLALNDVRNLVKVPASSIDNLSEVLVGNEHLLLCCAITLLDLH